MKLRHASATLFVTLAAGLGASAVSATDADVRSIRGMAHHQRVLLVFSPTLGDARLQQQRRVMAHFAAGAAERDLAFVQVSQGRVLGANDKADRLRTRFHAPDDRYRSILIGKDGNVAMERDAPIEEAALAATIDAMPMRQEEVRRAKAGLGRLPG